jgi:alpha-tubulin suppressor-like RCC1 family protein
MQATKPDQRAPVHLQLKDEFTSLIYAWGGNDRHQLGVGLTHDKVKKPTLMPSVAFTVTKIACGISHTLCLTN